MFELFRKKSYLIKWQRSIYAPHVVNETVIWAKCEADANWKFLQGHNAELEQINILGIKQVD